MKHPCLAERVDSLKQDIDAGHDVGFESVELVKLWDECQTLRAKVERIEALADQLRDHHTGIFFAHELDARLGRK